jgi:hypothetical protein
VAEVNDFSSSCCVQTSSELQTDFYSVGTGGPFPGVKRSRVVTLTTDYHIVRMVKNEWEL